MPAPFYVKGFIKLYAERVGLDPAPLVRDYLARHAQLVQPTLVTENPPPRSAPMPARAPDDFRRPTLSSRDLVEKGRTMAVQVARDVDGAVRQAVNAISKAWAARGELRRGVMRDPRMAREFGRAAELPVGRYAAIGMAVIVVAIIIGFTVSLLMKPSPVDTSTPVAVSVPNTSKSAPETKASRLRLAEEPPAPYLKPRKP
jgi:hypothetical protein